jgi:ubiquinone/menaquinone biosynthesis C-methylase UbiE
VSERELERARAAYRARDASAESPYRWDNPGYVTYIQAVERALLDALADAGVQLVGARVLDVGCGGGYFLHRLREYGAGECHGIDLVEERVESARRRYPSLEVHVGSATELPFEDASLDLVTQFTCLSSIVDDSARAVAAREMRRVAGADGSVLSFDLRRPSRAAAGTTATVGLDERALRALFGEPRLLRRVAPRFELAQLAGRHHVVTSALALLPPLRSHLLGIWPAQNER